MCDKIISATNSVSTNVTSTVSTNFCSKKTRNETDFYFQHTVLLVIILLFTITMQKTQCCINNTKMVNNKFKKVSIKNRACYYMDCMKNHTKIF